MSAIIRQVQTQLQTQILRFVASAAIVAAIVFVYFKVIHVNPTTVALTLLLAILVVSAVWALRVAIFMSVLATLAFNYFFLPPVGTFTIADPQNWVALFAFLTTAIVASQLAERVRREAEDANRRRHEAERLYAFSQDLLVSGNVTELLNVMPKLIVRSFGIQAAAIFIASTKEVYLSSADAREIGSEELQQVMAREEMVSDAARSLSMVPVRLGVRTIGSLGVKGQPLSRQTLEALASLVAIGMERARAVEELGKAEASREGERLRTALLDSVTHELRTPLTSIKASVTGLLSGQQLDAAQRRELLSVINEEADRLNTLVAEAATMTRLDAGEIELRLEPHPICEAIEAAMEQTKRLLAGHRVEVKVPPDLPPVPVDLVWIKEVLVHLLENAAQYSPPDSPITVSSEVQGRSLVTSVADRGPGIDELERALIFDKFYRGKDQRYRVQGTGMGLAIAKAIVEAHGGTIGLTSQLGHGSVFQFALPLDSAGAKA